MDPWPSDLRHAIRGKLNALKLCVATLQLPLESHELLEFTDDIECAAGEILELLNQAESRAQFQPPAATNSPLP